MNDNEFRAAFLNNHISKTQLFLLTKNTLRKLSAIIRSNEIDYGKKKFVCALKRNTKKAGKLMIQYEIVYSFLLYKLAVKSAMGRLMFARFASWAFIFIE